MVEVTPTLVCEEVEVQTSQNIPTPSAPEASRRSLTPLGVLLAMSNSARAVAAIFVIFIYGSVIFQLSHFRRLSDGVNPSMTAS